MLNVTLPSSMDRHGFRLPLGHQPPPSPPSSDASFPILAISILGILATSILLLSYYVFAVRCCLNWRRSDVVGRLSRSRRRLDDRLMAYSTVAERHGLGRASPRPQHLFRSTNSWPRLHIRTLVGVVT
ncbi:hypothetical protein OPV22_012160 [Ensete ventricosum]|uniref:RING-type E3 ubiquitin transferase n=1 Tax=Ensete ventricosum TaxID=4639 RepID=A0AAV8QXX7_ENSVE|nr:hypothetical protein OPV22_012160 [Ensete ventricosum]